ncbi:uncharacterized protein LOC112569597 [Pomacea canaliculata]|uniref:uncharacterized protein LOC112569597 n=1 Tax=Pomacea canaliculata TaxID=400727 RepID=UPI000D72ED74|nr:uncharacterized protein LOC112569597 [Pomacea canaliculata]
MSKILWFAFLFVLFHKGNAETECDASDGTNVKCKFFEDISSTRTNFALYFYYENGKTELLADCSWVNDNLHCIEQEGVKCKQPVSDVAEIIVPIKFASRLGAYGCTTGTLSLENIKLCRSFNTQSKVEEGQNDLKYQHLPKENADFDTITNFIGSVLPAFFAGLILMGLVIGLKDFDIIANFIGSVLPAFFAGLILMGLLIGLNNVMKDVNH